MYATFLAYTRNGRPPRTGCRRTAGRGGPGAPAVPRRTGGVGPRHVEAVRGADRHGRGRRSRVDGGSGHHHEGSARAGGRQPGHGLLFGPGKPGILRVGQRGVVCRRWRSAASTSANAASAAAAAAGTGQSVRSPTTAAGGGRVAVAGQATSATAAATRSTAAPRRPTAATPCATAVTNAVAATVGLAVGTAAAAFVVSTRATAAVARTTIARCAVAASCRGTRRRARIPVKSDEKRYVQ